MGSNSRTCLWLSSPRHELRPSRTCSTSTKSSRLFICWCHSQGSTQSCFVARYATITQDRSLNNQPVSKWTPMTLFFFLAMLGEGVLSLKLAYIILILFFKRTFSFFYFLLHNLNRSIFYYQSSVHTPPQFMFLSSFFCLCPRLFVLYVLFYVIVFYVFYMLSLSLSMFFLFSVFCGWCLTSDKKGWSTSSVLLLSSLHIYNKN